MNQILRAILILGFLSCEKDKTNYILTNNPIPNILDPNCVDTNVVPKINVLNSPDLYVYLVYHDSLYGTAIKSVPGQGFIEWKANSYVEKFKNKYGLTFINYLDTTLGRGFSKYIYSREILGCEIDFNKTGRQQVVPDHIYKQDTSKLRGFYMKQTADGDVLDACWIVDPGSLNYLEITCINWDAKIVEGKFELNFILVEQSRIPGRIYAYNAHFRCGDFKVKFD